MNKPMDNAGNAKKKKPNNVGFSDKGNDTDEEGDEDENKNNNWEINPKILKNY